MVEWRSVVGFEGVYEISNTGLVKRVGRATAARVGRILRPRYARGYEQAALTVKCNYTYRYVHHLVIEAFCGPKPTKDHQVNHKNGIKTDNRIENLEWVTGQENLVHARATGLIDNKGEKHHNARITTAEVLEIRRLAKSGESLSSLSSTYGVMVGQIKAIITRTRWKHV